MKRKPPTLRSIGIDLNARSIGTLSCDYEVELVHGCCHRFLADYPFEDNELVYSDPPYLMSTRKSQRRYRYHYGEADHEALLGLLRSLPCSVMMGAAQVCCNLAVRHCQCRLSIKFRNQAAARQKKCSGFGCLACGIETAFRRLQQI